MAKYRDRITQKNGQGITIKRSGTPAEPQHTKHFVGADHELTEDEALELGRKLFDSIATEQAKIARKKK